VRPHDGAGGPARAINPDEHRNLSAFGDGGGVSHRLIFRKGRPVRGRSGGAQHVVNLEI